ncbi:hypothetical protein [Hymenobacter perfusus]|uniref:Uncharacterized protein n=1 Tax=Hymenobacter perfusus TaxID=1236770 RepID=A0A3R9MFH7_9BACT|nr:hypothetical protein [Hymenobacter perfusus]RSK44685.1 hypothetical protein EI293_09245 [Hymenobacter perfusus]
MTALYLRLQQLRAELETSESSAGFGPTVLFAIRRELLRHLLQVPYPTLQAGPTALLRRFESVIRNLQAAATFPASSRERQLSEARQALDVLTEFDKRTPPLAAAAPTTATTPRGQRS